MLIRVDPVELDQALQLWNAQYGAIDQSLAIDGKTMCNAINDNGRKTHIMCAVGHQRKQWYTKKNRQLSFSTRMVLDYLKITGNTHRVS